MDNPVDIVGDLHDGSSTNPVQMAQPRAEYLYGERLGDGTHRRSPQREHGNSR